MITRTFLSKCNTIANFSKENYGLNPICGLSYGNNVSRVLLYFNEEKLKQLVDDGTYKLKNKLSHRLKMTNCGSINVEKFFEKDAAAKFLSQKHRASSFNVIAFKIPKKWDAGNGFDNSTDAWFLGYKSTSHDGSTWEKARNGELWSSESGLTNGIYSTDFLEDEYEKYLNGIESIIIGVQHFDYGNENLDIDITDYVNSVLFDEEENYGLCLAISPDLEHGENENGYINFFTNNTNTFFAPYIETRYNILINDDRYKFYLGKKNKLYFYAVIGGRFVELDEMPICKINGKISEVFSETKGIYYTEVKLSKNEKEGAIIEDEWSNLKLNGENIEEITKEFVTLPYKSFFSFGEEVEESVNLNPVISGINDDEKLNQGNIREISVTFRHPYTTTEYELVDECYYRVYVKDGNREIDVINWEPISTIEKKNLFKIDTNELIPQKYYVDIKANIGRQVLIFKNKLEFTVVNNVTELKK